MTLYGFVASLLILFAIATNSMMHKQTLTQKTQISYEGFMRVSRDVQGQIEKHNYKTAKRASKKTPKPDPEKDNKDKKKIPPTPPSSLRGEKQQEREERNKKSKERFPACSRLNLYPLIKKKPQENKELLHIFERLIQTLYENSTFYPKKEKNFAKKMALSICHAAHEQLIEEKNPLHKKRLEKLFLSSSSMQQIYYKMLKGSLHYDFEKEIGYPSLLDYIKIEEGKESKICLSCAPYEVLSYLFSPSVAQTIIAKREKSKNPLTEEEIKTIVFNNRQSPTYANLFKVVQTSCKSQKKYPITFIAEDTEAGIKVHKRLNLPK